MSQTLIEYIKQETKTLAQYHPDTATIEINYLLLHALNISKSELILRYQAPVNSIDLSVFKEYLNQRIKGVPLDLILGYSEFRNHDYIVKKGVLLPRAETEIVVEELLNQISQRQGNSFTLVECGSGSGIISIECALAYPTQSIHAWDISKEAIELSIKNQKKHNVTTISWHHQDFFDKSAQWRTMKGEIILVSNPPYISKADMEQLDSSVKNYDPELALYGGEDGLDFYKKCLREIHQKIQCIIFECGYNQAEDIISFASSFGYDGQFVPDLKGIPRVIILKKV